MIMSNDWNWTILNLCVSTIVTLNDSPGDLILLLANWKIQGADNSNQHQLSFQTGSSLATVLCLKTAKIMALSNVFA